MGQLGSVVADFSSKISSNFKFEAPKGKQANQKRNFDVFQFAHKLGLPNVQMRK